MTMKITVSKKLLLIPTTKKRQVMCLHNAQWHTKIPLEIIAFSLCSEFSITNYLNEQKWVTNSEEYMYSHFKSTPTSPYLQKLAFKTSKTPAWTLHTCTPSGKPLRLAKQWRMLILCWFKFLTQFFKWPVFTLAIPTCKLQQSKTILLFFLHFDVQVL